MAELTWSDAFLLGFGPMDEVHREFVDLVGKMLVCLDTELLELLRRFERHAESHFAQEHEWMRSTDFPATDCHHEEHSAVLKSVREVLPLVEQGNVELGRSLARALADWFPGHADYLDSALALWMVKRKTGGAPIVLKRSVAQSADSGET